MYIYQNDKEIKPSYHGSMGAYDWVELCELIGICMLYLIGKKYDSKNIGLYRDVGLAVFKNLSGSSSEKVKKTFTIFV